MDRSSGTRWLATVPLFLAESSKSVETAPNGISMGMILLRSWQIHRLPRLPADVAGRAGYLVRSNYDFDLEPAATGPRWAEIVFSFPEDVIVLDAVPRLAVSWQDATVHDLDQHLNFTPRNGYGDRRRSDAVAWDITLPPLLGGVACSGIGGNLLRWRHTGPQTTAPGAREALTSGSHTGWFVLLTPLSWREVKVLVDGRYDPTAEIPAGRRAAAWRDGFDVALPTAGSGSESPADYPPRAAAAGGGRRVFISYAQESPDHKADVEKLCGLLEQRGVDVRIDQQGLEARRNWTDWTTTQILRSDYVIVVASAAYLAASTNALPPSEHRGIRSEYLRLADLLHRDRPLWTRKILPVVLPGHSPDEIPLDFMPGTQDYYPVKDFTPRGAEDLLRVLATPIDPPASPRE